MRKKDRTALYGHLQYEESQMHELSGGETRTANAIIEATPTILRSTPNTRGDRQAVSSIAFGKKWGWAEVLSNTSENFVYTHPHTHTPTHPHTHIKTHTQIHDINIENVRYEIPYHYG
jgi:hypothetical protein